VKLFLDEMISPRVAEDLRQRGHDVVAAAERGTLGRSDAHQLAVAIREGRALVTSDVRDFSVLAKAATVAGTEHRGIVFVPRARFSRLGAGPLISALEALLSRNPEPEAMNNRVLFLERA
jgi:NAD(P)-dependent dehydrogenase (short-subunit alcohol dehydrogenase family)